jgi:hypothetical protein
MGLEIDPADLENCLRYKMTNAWYPTLYACSAGTECAPDDCIKVLGWVYEYDKELEKYVWVNGDQCMCE